MIGWAVNLLREAPGVQRAEVRYDELLLLVCDHHCVVTLLKDRSYGFSDSERDLQVRIEAVDVPDLVLRRRLLYQSGPTENTRVEVVRRVDARVRDLARRLGTDVEVSVADGVFTAVTPASSAAALTEFVLRAAELRSELSRDMWGGLIEAGFEEVEPNCFRTGLVEVAGMAGPQTRVVLRGGFPLSCVHGDQPLPDHHVDTHNPVVGSLVHVAGDPEPIRALLQEGDFVGALLELVHGHPGSSLSPSALMLVVPGVAENPLELVAKAEDLAARLTPSA